MFSPTEVNIKSAISILLDEIENSIKELNKSLNTAALNYEYDKAIKISEKAKLLREFKNKAMLLKEDWNKIIIGKSIIKSSRKSTRKLRRGLKTPERDYYIPILQSIIALGGEGEASEILEKVYELMKDNLKPYDLEGLNTNPLIIRWNNTARWCRAAMVKEGLLTPDSPRGIWRITDKGKEYLDKNK